MAERLRGAPAWLLAAALAVLYLILQPPTADHAAQHYRAALGLVVWDGGWYGGHHMPAYSVLFPPIASLIGARATGALAAVAAAGLFERAVDARFDRAGARLAALWFALGTGAVLVSGRLTYLVGVAVALAAIVAAERGRTRLTAAAAVLTGLASPVAAAFLALAAIAWWVGEWRWAAAADRHGPGPALARVAPLGLVVAALAPVGLLAWAFPEGGSFPFVASSFWPAFLLSVAVALALPRERRTLKAGAALYALAIAASFVLQTPMGGNAVRLGSLFAGPLLAAALWPRRPRLLALLALPLLWFQWGSAIDDWARAAPDPSVHRAYYAPLLQELGRRGATAGRAGLLEIPFTDNHWESRWVAPHVPLARGWERQLDIARNPLFYDDAPLTPARYRRWLDANAVGWVALADAPLDYSAAREAQLIRDGLPYLREVWRGGHWRLFAVRRRTPLATGPATVTRVAGEAVDLRARAPGAVALRVRWTPYWALVRGAGCVERRGDRVLLRLRSAGGVRLAIRFAPGRIRAAAARCTP